MFVEKFRKRSEFFPCEFTCKPIIYTSIDMHTSIHRIKQQLMFFLAKFYKKKQKTHVCCDHMTMSFNFHF